MNKPGIDLILLQNILQHGNLGVHIIDRERKTKVYNETMAKLEGLEVGQVMDKDILDIFPSLNEHTSTLIKVMNTGEEIFDSTQNYLNYRGHSITIISTTLPIYYKGAIIGAMEIAQDVTSIRELSDQLFELQSQLNINIDVKTKHTIKKYNFSDIIGKNENLLAARRIGEKSSKTPSSVLIYGETGTGKEMFAQSIHNGGNRAKQSFIAQNCAAIPESLLEGLLFGTEKGGFTGAIEREGIFEQANGGTLLLDEINSMAISLQAKLLRVLQEGYIRRIGGTKDIPIDIKIIATTNENPRICIENGSLRSDLYYRLSVVNIVIPPLRERVEDIEILCQFFINKYNALLNKSIENISDIVLNEFKAYSWPGNIRELENFIEGAMNMVSQGDKVLNKEDFMSSYFIPVNIQNNHMIKLKENPLPVVLEEIEADLIKGTLKIYDNNITYAAKHLGIKRQTLQHKLKKYI